VAALADGEGGGGEVRPPGRLSSTVQGTGMLSRLAVCVCLRVFLCIFNRGSCIGFPARLACRTCVLAGSKLPEWS